MRHPRLGRENSGAWASTSALGSWERIAENHIVARGRQGFKEVALIQPRRAA
ncbi:MAG: hypothetical protein MZV63_06220 [Marinilabiliales bacterium]|nr:hypothetical protein [Marinilabiliales bacterium]